MYSRITPISEYIDVNNLCVRGKQRWRHKASASRSCDVTIPSLVEIIDESSHSWQKKITKIIVRCSPYVILNITWLIIGLRPTNERRSYFVTTSLFAWAQA